MIAVRQRVNSGHRAGRRERTEWIRDEDAPGGEWPMILRRNKAILAAYNEIWDKVWWSRHQYWLYQIETGKRL